MSVIFALVASAYAAGSIIPVAIEQLRVSPITGGCTPMGVLYNPVHGLFEITGGGFDGCPIDSANEQGIIINSVNGGFDYRGSWWNPNLDALELITYGPQFDASPNYGVFHANLDPDTGFPLGGGVELHDLMPANYPGEQVACTYNWNQNQLVCATDNSQNGDTAGAQFAIYNHSDLAFFKAITVSGLPDGVDTSALHQQAVGYSGVAGAELMLYNYNARQVYFFDWEGVFAGLSQLPDSAPTPNYYSLSWSSSPNGEVWVWLSDGSSSWYAYNVHEGPTPVPESRECVVPYRKLSHYTRGTGYKSNVPLGLVECENAGSPSPANDWQGPGWYRFTGAAGSQMPVKPTQSYQCGTNNSGWMAGSLPARKDGIVSRSVCFSFGGDACVSRTKINVVSCKGFFLYYLPAPPTSCSRYCGNGLGIRNVVVDGTIVTPATLKLKLDYSGCTPMNVVWNPDAHVFYALGGGSSDCIDSMYDEHGNKLSDVDGQFDYRAAWWNRNTLSLELVTYAPQSFNDSAAGVFAANLDANGYITGGGIPIIDEMPAEYPGDQAFCTYNWNANQLVCASGDGDYPGSPLYNTQIAIFDYSDGSFVEAIAVKGMPVDVSSTHRYVVGYSGTTGAEYMLYDYVNSRVYFFDLTGAFAGASQLPAGAPSVARYECGWSRSPAGNVWFWVFDDVASQWQGYEVLSDIGNGGQHTTPFPAARTTDLVPTTFAPVPDLTVLMSGVVRALSPNLDTFASKSVLSAGIAQAVIASINSLYSQTGTALAYQTSDIFITELSGVPVGVSATYAIAVKNSRFSDAYCGVKMLPQALVVANLNPEFNLNTVTVDTNVKLVGDTCGNACRYLEKLDCEAYVNAASAVRKNLPPGGGGSSGSTGTKSSTATTAWAIAFVLMCLALLTIIIALTVVAYRYKQRLLYGDVRPVSATSAARPNFSNPVYGEPPQGFPNSSPTYENTPRVDPNTEC